MLVTDGKVVNICGFEKGRVSEENTVPKLNIKLGRGYDISVKCFTETSNFLVLGTSNSIFVFGISMQNVCSIPLDTEVTSLTLLEGQDSRQILVVGVKGGTIKIYDFAKLVLKEEALIGEQSLYYVGDLYQILKVDYPGLDNPQSDQTIILSGEYGLFYGIFTKDYSFDVKASEKFFAGSSVSQITFMQHNSTNRALSFLLTHAV